MEQIEAKTELQLLIEEREAIESRLKAIQKEQEEALRRAKDAVKIAWKFTWTPVPEPHKIGFDRIMEGSGLVMWRLQGHVMNEEECKAVHKDTTNANGGMNYYVNALNGKIALESGGGSVFITRGDPFWNRNNTREELEADREQCMRLLEEFMRIKPEGGEVTNIILGQKFFRWS